MEVFRNLINSIRTEIQTQQPGHVNLKLQDGGKESGQNVKMGSRKKIDENMK